MKNDNLLLNIDKIHTTKLGLERIKNNLKVDGDIIGYCKKIILDNQCEMTRCGKNYYCKKDNIIITINSYSLTVITAHMK